VKEIALKIAAMPKVNEAKPRKVLITQGSQPTIFVENGVVTEFPVLPIAPEQIVDTNGAGDAFVGGFLAALVNGKSTAECIKTGQYTALVIIQQPGCTLPSYAPDAAYL